MNGVYVIINNITKKRYYGSAAQKAGIDGRLRSHKNCLRNNKHKNKYLQNSWNKHGEENFIFEVFIYCDRDKCVFFEQKCLDTYQPFADTGNGYNIAKNVVSPALGTTASKETRKKQRLSAIGKNKGRRHTPEAIEKLKIANTGEKNSFYGKKHSDENVEKWKKLFVKKMIERIDILTGEIKEYRGLHDAARDGFDRRAIKRCCKNLPKNKTHKGYFWNFGVSVI